MGWGGGDIGPSNGREKEGGRRMEGKGEGAMERRERNRDRERERGKIREPHQFRIEFFIEDGFVLDQCHSLSKPTRGNRLL